MPASVSAKIEKRQSSSVAAAPAAPSAAAAAVADNPAAPGAAVDNSSPIRQALVIIEHKIRNLEKRKAKLETYRDLEKSGKELNSDMKLAVSKYGEVAQTLEFARDFSKQILLIANASELELKKKAKKEEKAKKQADLAKLREVLVMQDILSMMEDDVVREDFMKEENGACKLDSSALELLDKFYLEVTPRRPENHEETPFKTTTTRAADHLLATLEMKDKPFASEKETYAHIRTLLKEIQKCGYFDKASQPPPPPAAPVVDEVTVDEPAIAEEPIDVPQEPQVVEGEVEQVSTEPDFQVAPAADAVPAPSFPPHTASVQHSAVQPLTVQQQQQQLPHPQLIHPQPTPLNGPPGQLVQPIPLGANLVVGVPGTIKTVPIQQPQNQPIHPGHLAPTTVRAVEQAYFKQHQYITQMRPLAEVINAQNFFFLQDSELDVCDVMAQPPITAGFPLPSNQISPNLQQHQPNSNIQNQHQPQQPPPQQQPQHLQQSQMIHLNSTVRSSQQPQQQQQAPPQPMQTQISSQSFNNPSFPGVISGAAIFSGALKSSELSQTHIPGFANANAPIPIPLLTQQPVQQPQQLASQSQPLHNSVLQQQQQSSNPIPSIPTFPSQQQTGTGFLPLQQPIVPSSSPIVNHPHQSSSSLATVKINQANKPPLPDVETRVPEITEWKPEEATKQLPDELSNEWQGQYFQATNVEPEVSDWNEDSTTTTTTTAGEESNAWSPNGQQRFPYRNHQGGGGGGYNSSRANNNRSGQVARNAASAVGNTDSSNNNTNGGYRNRPAYQTNGGGAGGGGGNGRQQQQSQSTSGSSGNGTFYRNNETYYQNGNNGGGGGYRGGDKSGGGYRGDNKQDGYRGGNNFRSRETSGNTGGAVRGSGGMQSRSNNRYNSDSAERGQSAGSRSNTNAGGPSPVGGGQVSRPVATTTKQHTVYGGGPRPSGARQTVNV